MNGIDISHWQNGIDLSKIKCDFVIAKATEGTTITDKSLDTFLKQAQKLGKCLGFYHFARPESNDAIKEAQYFYKATKNYYGKGIPVLDWESKGKANIAWAKKWLDEIYRLTGVKPLIYMSTSVVNSYDWSNIAKAGYGLWVAQYRDNTIDRNYDMTNAGSKPKVKYWPTYAMWQWTSKGRLDGYSGDLDCDIFYGNKTAWNKYAGITNTSKPSETTSKLPETGVFSNATVKRLQKWLNVAQNGKIAGQTSNVKKYIPAMAPVCTWTGGGSAVIRALQKHLKAKKFDPGTIDGLCGKKTVTALQKYLKSFNFDPGTIDGILGAKTTKALQRFLNTK